MRTDAGQLRGACQEPPGQPVATGCYAGCVVRRFEVRTVSTRPLPQTQYPPIPIDRLTIGKSAFGRR
ncbi:hypothetical protein A4G26_27695 [Mycobacterium kansasii]|nr:hypothetical protein A4G26_27695 [Mycobacterium kansasii]KZS76252.1 hypothetical protein A4G29_04495 [Mycobacterium kansasii]